MSSLTTLFIVGPEEYVEFNESMGSKAFLEHVWDQGTTPLKKQDTSAAGTYLHSAGARVSPDPPPRIEFPTVLRVKGKGNKYKQTGKWISWEALKSKHPLALLDPPNLEEFIRRGATVGSGEKIETGAWLRENKVTKGGAKGEGEWVGGSSQSIYAIPASQPQANGQDLAAAGSNGGADGISHSSAPDDGWIGASDAPARPSKARLSVKLGGGAKVNSAKGDNQAESAKPRQIRKSRSGLSLSERLGMEDIKEASKEQPMPSTSSSTEAASPVIDRREGSRRSRPSRLDLPDTPPMSSLNPMMNGGAQIPLSASHPPPETPLKHAGRHQRVGSELPSTPGSELAFHNANAYVGAMRKGGLLLDPGEGDPVLPKELQTPGKEKFLTPLTESSSSSTPGPSLPAKIQIDNMLAKLKLARPSAGGTQESRWAVKATEDKANGAGNASESLGGQEKKKTIADEGSGSMSLANDTQDAASHPSAPAGSLRSRMSAPPETKPENAKPAKGKKERKRGSRKTETPLNHVVEPVVEPLAPTGVKERNGASIEPPAVSPSASVAEAVPPPKTEAPPREEEVSEEKTNKLPNSTSAASVATAASLESSSQTSNAANDTITSINWADDDDDLPDLPEEWTRLPSTATAPEVEAVYPSSTTQSVPPSPALGGGSPTFDGANAGSKRGAKRGGKGRTKKERDERHPDVPSAPRGLQIAGSAARAANKTPVSAPPARKELFPSHGVDAASLSKGPKTASSDHQHNGGKESRPHGRPKLATSGRDAFDRLAKGAISMSSPREGAATNDGGGDRHRRPPGEQAPNTQSSK